VAINNGTCESTRTPVVATINTLPSAPTVNSNAACGPISIILTAAGGVAGQYRWYTVPTGGTAIVGQTNSAFQTPVLTTTTTYYVSINNGTCESARTAAIATILSNGCNTIPPTISPVPLTTIVAGQIVLDLVPLITAPGVLNLNSITITSPPSSGASASVSNGILTIDYAGKVFTGNEFITIQACDVASLCSEQTFTIEVAGDIVVYNGISPNNDPARANETFYIKYIDVIPSKQKNTVAIFNRWGSKVFEVSDYNNNTRVFKGLNDNGDLLPTGTYFYKISFDSGDETKTGYLVIKH
jgi:gliding motility-associated-like protein